MKKLILFAISFLLASAAWTQEAPATAPNGSTETINADNVPIEEYVPKVIIEGKWGTGPGEFGYDGFYLEGFVPKSASFTPDDFIYPRSLAIDSKGNIYILDIANNRIQKFDAIGKYQTEFKVDSWSGYKKRQDGNDGYVCEIKGINVVIDSKDNLFYYLKRIKDEKETGEVWKFKHDKLVRKINTDPKSIDDPKNPKGIPYSQHPARNWLDTDLEPEKNGFFVAVEKERKKALEFKLTDDEEMYGHKKAVYDKLNQTWKVRVKSKTKIWDYMYNSSGKLFKKIEAHYLSQFTDSRGSYYFIDTAETGVVIRKDELVRVK